MGAVSVTGCTATVAPGTAAGASVVRNCWKQVSNFGLAKTRVERLRPARPMSCTVVRDAISNDDPAALWNIGDWTRLV